MKILFLPMIEKTLETLKKYFSFSEFRTGQYEAIKSVLEKKDTLVVMPTGSGKSLCYQIPGLILEGVTIVVSPLISLMKDQVDSLKNRKIKATLINSSLEYGDICQRINEIRYGIHKFLYVSPERFESKEFLNQLSDIPISLFVIDEAHCISEWGHDFRPSYLKLNKAIHFFNNPPVIALTATATTQVQDDILVQLKLNKAQKIVTGFDRPNLSYSVFNDVDKLQKILKIIRGVKGGGIIYAATRKNVELVSDFLNENNIECLPYHAGLPDKIRKQTQDKFIKDEICIIAATMAFGMGIDKPNIRFIIHYDLPKSIEQYYQESGRAGRDGKKSYCVILYNDGDRKLQEYFVYNSYPSKEQIMNIYDFIYDSIQTGIGNRYLDFLPLASEEIIKYNPTTNNILINSILNILEEYNYIKQVNANNKYPTIKFLISLDKIKHYEKITPSLKTKTVINSLLRYPGNEATFRETNFDLNKFCRLCDMNENETLEVIKKLHYSGYLVYTAPTKGKGLYLLRVRIQSHKLEIDYKNIQKRLNYDLKKLNQIEYFTKLNECRRNYILNYFGETDIHGKCGKCDICLGRLSGNNVEYDDVTKLIVLNAISSNKNISLKLLISLLLGDKSYPDILYNRNKYFGVLKYLSNKAISNLIIKLLNEGFVIRNTKTGSDLSLSNKGLDYLNKQAKSISKIPNTIFITYSLYRKGLNIEKIAKYRRLTESTISKHIEELISNEFEIEITQFVSKEVLEKVRSAIKIIGVEKIPAIKELVDKEISYQDIRIIKAWYMRHFLSLKVSDEDKNSYMK